MKQKNLKKVGSKETEIFLTKQHHLGDRCELWESNEKWEKVKYISPFFVSNKVYYTNHTYYVNDGKYISIESSSKTEDEKAFIEVKDGKIIKWMRKKIPIKK